jgi:hypothetical protein
MLNVVNNHNNLKKYIDMQNNIHVSHPRIPWYLSQQLLKKLKTHIYTQRTMDHSKITLHPSDVFSTI